MASQDTILKSVFMKRVLNKSVSTLSEWRLFQCSKENTQKNILETRKFNNIFTLILHEDYVKIVLNRKNKIK